MKRLLALVICLWLVVQFTVPAAAITYVPDVPVNAKSAYLYNMDTDTLIYNLNMDQPQYPASLTKIMTCILALENTPDLDSEKVVYPNYVQDYLYNYQRAEGYVSLADLSAGEVLTMRQLLYAAMLPSGNDAAMIIADHIGGSQEGFAQMMNQRARELGATNTNFVNACGLHEENHYSTARDMALLTMHALELPGFEEIVNTPTYESGPTSKQENISWTTTNKMMIPNHAEYYPGLKGVKTGSTPEAGDCLVSTCTRDGFTYLLVVMGSPGYDEEGNALGIRGAFEDTRNIYDWVFDFFKRKSLVEKGKHVEEVPLRLSSEKDYLKLMTDERFTALVPKDTEAASVTMVAELPDHVDAPIEKGDSIGELRLILGGEEIGRVGLVAAETVTASPLLVVLDKIQNVMKSFWFKFAAILLVLLIIVYIVLMVLRNKRRRQNNYRPRRRL